MKQHIVFNLCVEFESEDDNPLDLQSRKEELEKLIFHAVERERQECALSPKDLSANWITVDALRIVPAGEATDDCALLSSPSPISGSSALSSPDTQQNKYLPEIVATLIKERSDDGEYFSGETKSIDIKLAAFTRLEYSESVKVPVEFGEEQLDEIVDRTYDAVDGGDYWDDPDYWERATCGHENSN